MLIIILYYSISVPQKSLDQIAVYTVAWFDALIWIKHKTREEAVQKAREYVDKMREKYQYSLPPLSDYEPVLSKLYCIHHGECETSE